MFINCNSSLFDFSEFFLLRLVEDLCASIYQQLSGKTHAYKMSKCTHTYTDVSYYFFSMSQFIDELQELHYKKYKLFQNHWMYF